jgi:coproporphyrinogen III oxidase-like Fe-S oxidoreductase
MARSSMRRAAQGGFGYDPYFLVPDLGLTVAELPHEEKNRRSHRGQALAQLIARLRARDVIPIHSGGRRPAGADYCRLPPDWSRRHRLSLYVHWPWCVRKCPVLRFQFA